MAAAAHRPRPWLRLLHSYHVLPSSPSSQAPHVLLRRVGCSRFVNHLHDGAIHIVDLRPQAKEAYRKALDLEPEDAQLQNLLHQSDIAERKAMDQRKHKFRSNAAPPAAKRARNSSSGDGRSRGSSGGGRPGGKQAQKPSKGPKLSFEDDE